MKTCKVCGKDFPATTEYFYSQADCLDGLRGECKECKKKKVASYSKKNITYKNKRNYEDNDIDEYIAEMRILQAAAQKINTKQVKAEITINDNKPIGIAFWGDWHIGAVGTDYAQLEKDIQTMINTDGLYFIGAGDYKDNYITGTHPGGNFEQIIQPGMQDMVVKRYMSKVKDKCLALIRGCHDSWDMKQANKDFLETLCLVTDSINLWHGGEVKINIGQESYLWRCRHKYKYQSSLNLENAMRRINELQGPCDVAAEAHLHNPYTMQRHLMGEYRVMLRSGSYKVWDEYGQQLAGYKGKIGVPVVILYPDKHRMLDIVHLDVAVKTLNNIRK